MSVVQLKVPHSNNTIINSHWFGKVGAVLVEDQVTKKTMCYIGVALNNADTQTCELNIAMWGDKVPKAVAESLFGRLGDYKVG